MTVNAAYLADIASEFSAIDSGRVDRLVAIASSQVPAAVWPNATQRDLGIAYLVAHMLKLDQLKGKGAVTSESIGDLSKAFAVAASAKADALELTSYGAAYKQLRNMQARGPLIT